MSIQTFSRFIVAVGSELDDVQEAERERPALALEAERPARRLAAPHRLVDQEVVAVEAADALDLAVRQVGEQRLVERPGGIAAVGRAGRPADDVVLGIGRERRQHPGDVVLRLEGEVLVHPPIHLAAAHCHDALLRPRVEMAMIVVRLKSHVNT